MKTTQSRKPLKETGYIGGGGGGGGGTSSSLTCGVLASPALVGFGVSLAGTLWLSSLEDDVDGDWSVCALSARFRASDC